MCTKKNLNEFREWLNQTNDPPIVALKALEPLNAENWLGELQNILSEEKQTVNLKLHTGSISGISLSSIDYLCKPTKNNITNINELSYVPWQKQTKKIKNLNIRTFKIPSHGSYDDIQIENCWIDKLELSDDCDINIYLKNVFIGKLHLRQKCIHNLNWNGGGILTIRCITPDNRNPFTGHIYIADKDFYLPSRDNEYKNEKSTPQPWTNIRAHLMALDNIEAAGKFHSVEQKIERPLLPRITKFFNVLYGFFSNYGNSIWRPLAGILFSILISFLCFYSLSNSLLANDSVSWTKDVSIFKGAAWVSIEPIINPLEILNDKEYFEPATLGLVTFHSFHRMFVILMMFFLFLALRRKFRITA